MIAMRVNFTKDKGVPVEVRAGLTHKYVVNLPRTYLW